MADGDWVDEDGWEDEVSAQAAAPAGAPPKPGVPDLGVLNALRTQFHQGLMKGGSDETVGALFSSGDRHGPGAYLRMPDGSEVPVPTREALYRAGRDFVRMQQASATTHHPKLGFLAQVGGDVASDVALAGPAAVKRGYQTLAGLARGFMGSNAELMPSGVTWGSGLQAGAETLLGGTIGRYAPAVASRIVNSGPVQFLGSGAGQISAAAGNRLKDLAGWLKVNSIHPTPKLAEAMEALPGGASAVGRELLERGVGGLTKGGTAKQTQAAVSEAGQVINSIATKYDDVGGAPINIGDALDVAKVKAEALFKEPTTRAAGEKLATLIGQYEEALGPSRVLSATQALEMKRALAKAAYGASTQLKKTGDAIVGEYGKGLSAFERAVDDVMDKALGPEFGSANLVFRRLLGASGAAERDAARQQTNLLALGLQNIGGAGVGTMLGGGPGAVAGLAGMALLRKYGSQAGARTLYGAGNLTQAAPRLSDLLQGAARGPAPQTAATATLRDLLNPSVPQMSVAEAEQIPPEWASAP